MLGETVPLRTSLRGRVKEEVTRSLEHVTRTGPTKLTDVCAISFDENEVDDCNTSKE